MLSVLTRYLYYRNTNFDIVSSLRNRLLRNISFLVEKKVMVHRELKADALWHHGTLTFPEVKVFLYWKQLGLQGLPCLETIEIRTQNLSTIIKNHKAHTDTDINADRQDKTSSSFPPEMAMISVSRFFLGSGGWFCFWCPLQWETETSVGRWTASKKLRIWSPYLIGDPWVVKWPLSFQIAAYACSTRKAYLESV